MAITLTGSGGLFTRLGKLVSYLNAVNEARGSDFVDEAIAALATVDADTDPQIRDAMGAIIAQLQAGQNSLSGVVAGCRQAAERLLVNQVDADKPLPSRNVANALAELIRQLQVGNYYVDDNAIDAVATQTGLDGDGVIVASVLDPMGRPLENLIAEMLECRVVSTLTAGSEIIQVAGEERQPDRLHWQWPRGSGAFRQYVAVDAASATANLLANGGFENCTGPAVDDWTDDVGAYGTDWVIEETSVFKGSKAVELVGDGVTLAAISQDITARVQAFRQYAFCIWVRRDGSAAAAGELTIDLFDGSDVIEDAAGNDNEIVIDLTALSDSYVAYTGTFRLPEPLPPTVHLRMHLTTALTDTRSVFLDHVALAEMAQPLAGDRGATPYLLFFSGANHWTREDFTGGGDGSRVFQVTSINDRVGTWQQAFDRLFAMSERGLILPISGSNLIDANLIG